MTPSRVVNQVLTWSMVIVMFAAGGAPGQQVTGQWDFNNGNLAATVGADGSYWIVPATPPRDVAAETQFGSTASFGIADIDGQVAQVMRFPNCDNRMGYALYPQIEANGTNPDNGQPGQYVNQYTLIMDVYYPAASAGVYRALLQTAECNGNDADFFINGSEGIGISGNYQGSVTPDAWHRIVLALDATNTTDGYRKFIDGVLVGAQSGMGIDGRMTLYPTADDLPALLFADNDNETRPGYVNSIQIRNYQMTDAEVATLGVPSAAGIPGGDGVTGQWDFDNQDVTSTVGRSLVYFRGCQAGACPQSLANETQYGLGSQFGLPPINEVDPRVMGFPAVTACTGYLFPHGAAANGGGLQQKVNQYSLIMDIYFKQEDYTTSGDWISLMQTSPFNDIDAQLGIRTTDGAVGDGGQYGGTEGSCVADTWLRLAIVVDTTTERYSKYVNGALLATQGSSDVDDVHALFTTASAAGADHLLLFTDDDAETKAGYVNSIQIRDYAMSDEEVALLGGPTAAGIGFDDPPTARKAPDANNDGHVDDQDLGEFIACITGPGLAIAEDKILLCREFDVDDDSDVDQADFGLFQQYYTGSAGCAPNCFYP